MKPTVHGVGINDSKEKITTNNKSKQSGICPYYSIWKSILQRCYSPKCQEKHPTYKGCYVCEDWKYFSNFKQWMEKQDWEGKHLDKDLLCKGNKVYCPDNCVFISRLLNNFLLDSNKARGEFLIGVSKKGNRYQSNVGNPLIKKREYLGLYLTEQEAHAAWRKRKHEIAVALSKLETNPDIIKALTTRYKERDYEIEP